jgi:hypothetical protein
MTNSSGKASNFVGCARPRIRGDGTDPRPVTPEEFLGSPYFIAAALKAFERGILKAVAEDEARKKSAPVPR